MKKIKIVTVTKERDGHWINVNGYAIANVSRGGTLYVSPAWCEKAGIKKINVTPAAEGKKSLVIDTKNW